MSSDREIKRVCASNYLYFANIYVWLQGTDVDILLVAIRENHACNKNWHLADYIMRLKLSPKMKLENQIFGVDCSRYFQTPIRFVTNCKREQFGHELYKRFEVQAIISMCFLFLQFENLIFIKCKWLREPHFSCRGHRPDVINSRGTIFSINNLLKRIHNG